MSWIVGVALGAPLKVAASGHLLVQATLADQDPAWFVLDSGASVTMIATDRSTGLRDWRAIDVGGAGGEVQARLVREVPITVDGAPLELSYAVVMPIDDLRSIDPDIAGVIGLDVLRKHVVSIDREQGTIDWHAPIPARNPIKLGKTRGRLLTLDLQVPTGTMPGVLDLGADQTVLNAPAAVHAPELRAQTQLVGIDGAAQQAETAELAWCALGTTRTAPCEVTLQHLSVFEQLRMDDKPAAIVGLNVLGSGAVVLDARKKRLWLTP